MDETARELGLQLPQEGHYAVGNLFMKEVKECQDVFEQLANALGLQVLGWRQVPVSVKYILLQKE